MTTAANTIAASTATIRQSCKRYEVLTGKHVEFDHNGQRIRRATRVVETWRNMGANTIESAEYVQLDGRNVLVSELENVAYC